MRVKDMFKYLSIIFMAWSWVALFMGWFEFLCLECENYLPIAMPATVGVVLTGLLTLMFCVGYISDNWDKIILCNHDYYEEPTSGVIKKLVLNEKGDSVGHYSIGKYKCKKCNKIKTTRENQVWRD